MDISLLKKIGFSDKEVTVYLTLLRLGPSSVRTLAHACQLNRGTTYDSLKWLQDQGLVTFYHSESRQHFVGKDPTALSDMVHRQETEIRSAAHDLDRFVPELQALHHRGGNRPMARYYERQYLRDILEDVLATCGEATDRMYRIYSAEGVRKHLYENFPSFSDVRIEKGITVRVIAMGEGGALRGLDERRSLDTQTLSKTDSTYILIYPGKTAYISLDAKGEPVGVVIENMGIFETQKFIFDALWETVR